MDTTQVQQISVSMTTTAFAIEYVFAYWEQQSYPKAFFQSSKKIFRK